jgi:transposase-like protein
MAILEYLCCNNTNCVYYKKYNSGNIAVRSVYGVNKDRILYYCKNCKVTFSPTRNTPLCNANITKKTIRDIISLSSQGVGVRGIAEHLEISPRAVNRNIIKIGELCAEQLAKTVVSLDLVEVQLDEFWSFIKKNGLKRVPKYLTLLTKGQFGFGQQ